MQKQRLEYIDQLKGFAILMVVMGHILQFCFKENAPSLTFKVIMSFHMPLFAFLSGLMFTTIYDFKAIALKFKKQSNKLLIPFISFLVIYAYTIRPDEDMLTHPFKLGLWYLLFLWECYFLTHIYDAMLLKLTIHKSKRINIIMDIAWLLFTYLFFRATFSHLAQDVSGTIGIIHLYKLYPFFYIGCIIKRYSLFQTLFSCKQVYSDLSFILWIVMFVISIYLYSSPTLVLIIGCLAVYPIVSWFYRNGGGGKSRNGRTLALFGRYSMEIYILHRFLTSTCNLTSIGKYVSITCSLTIEIVIALFLSIVISYICIYISRFIRLNKILSIVLLGDKN